MVSAYSSLIEFVKSGNHFSTGFHIRRGRLLLSSERQRVIFSDVGVSGVVQGNLGVYGGYKFIWEGHQAHGIGRADGELMGLQRI